MVIFFFILKMVYCVYSLESPRWGDSNENTQYTFMLKKIEKISLLCLLLWRYDKHSFVRAIPVWNIFQGFKGVRATKVLLYQGVRSVPADLLMRWNALCVFLVLVPPYMYKHVRLAYSNIGFISLGFASIKVNCWSLELKCSYHF